jgi:hypothetical protein
MSTHDHPPRPARRPYAHEIEFASPALHQPGSLGALLDERERSIRARLLDPRLQRIIAAAANGWVVERLR